MRPIWVFYFYPFFSAFRSLGTVNATLQQILSAANYLNSIQPHRHDNIEEWPVDFEHAGAEFINQLDEHFIVGQRVERVNQVARVEGDGDFLALVVDGDGLARLADLRGVGGDG